MLTVHCLAFSRALRVMWLLEDLGVDYTMVFYERTDKFLAPDSLKQVHPLGKSPVIEDGDLTLAESATILRYLRDRYGDGRFGPHAGSPDFWHHEEWLDYGEGTLAPFVIADAVAKRLGSDAGARNAARLKDNLDYLSAHFDDGREFLMGGDLSLADIQLSYLMAIAAAAGQLEGRDALAAYWKRLQERPGYKAAIAKGGPMVPSRR